jgi:20S proteasome alpha/beta subunit
MITMIKWTRIRFLLIVALFLHSQAVSESISPIPNLEASLAASVAQSTTVAILVDDRCVLVVTRSPQSAASKLKAIPDAALSFEKHGLKLIPLDPSFGKWNLLAPDLFCTMTGLSADISHLTRVLAKAIESHRVIFEQNYPLHRCIRSLSSALTRATQRGGGRPFGVQALLVGLDSNPIGKWQLFTCDPTGLHRHHSTGRAVIGKYAEAVAKELATGEVDSPKDAIDLCITAILKAGQREHVQMDSDCYEAVLLWTDCKRDCKIAQLHPNLVHHIHNDIQRAVSP